MIPGNRGSQGQVVAGWSSRGASASWATCPCSVLVEGRALNCLCMSSPVTKLARPWLRTEAAIWEQGRGDSSAMVLSIPKVGLVMGRERWKALEQRRELGVLKSVFTFILWPWLALVEHWVEVLAWGGWITLWPQVKSEYKFPLMHSGTPLCQILSHWSVHPEKLVLRDASQGPGESAGSEGHGVGCYRKKFVKLGCLWRKGPSLCR